MNKNNRISILIPTLNAGDNWHQLLQAINTQSFQPYKKIIIDSGSADETISLARQYNFEVVQIAKKDYRHGATRQQLADLAGDVDICIFLTQDAIPASGQSFENLVKAFDDSKVGMGYGRQLPNIGAKVLETHARLYNYPDSSAVRTLADKERFGFKTIFCSDSFAAYRKTTLQEVGGFPPDTIMGEDTIVAANMLLAGYKIAYCADATVYHSHNYTLKEEFKRYFDTGVFHTQNAHLKKEFGELKGEGLRFLRSEIKYAFNHKIILIVYVGMSILAKALGYKLGSNFRLLNASMVRLFSMHKSYWSRYHTTKDKDQ